MIQVLWQFDVDGDKQAEFERYYGPEGTWVQLFRRAQGYLGTDLLRDSDGPLRYVTIDRWTTREAYDKFRDQFAAEYMEIDRVCVGFTIDERLIGYFGTLEDKEAADKRG